jgi:ABC-type branched-subunit amino acid transport system substrate-binding protein
LNEKVGTASGKCAPGGVLCSGFIAGRGVSLQRYREDAGAYFKMINEQRGVNGRKINLITLDDAYSPPKTVEQTRKLVEQEEVAAILNPLGTPTGLAVRKYLNDKKVPQLLVGAGAKLMTLSRLAKCLQARRQTRPWYRNAAD